MPLDINCSLSIIKCPWGLGPKALGGGGSYTDFIIKKKKKHMFNLTVRPNPIKMKYKDMPPKEMGFILNGSDSNLLIQDIECGCMSALTPYTQLSLVELRPPVSPITCPDLHHQPTQIIWNVQDVSHPLLAYILKFRFNGGGSHNPVEHMMET